MCQTETVSVIVQPRGATYSVLQEANLIYDAEFATRCDGVSVCAFSWHWGGSDKEHIKELPEGSGVY